MFLSFNNLFLSTALFVSNNSVSRHVDGTGITDLNVFFLKKIHLDRLSSYFSQNTETNLKKIFFTELELVGLGYRVSVRKSRIRLSLGYSHVIFLVVPKSISIVKRKYKILIYSKDCKVLGLFVSVLLRFKKLNPYKIKGLKEKSLIYKLKPGKRSK